jgi:hypothetical protein
VVVAPAAAAAAAAGGGCGHGCGEREGGRVWDGGRGLNRIGGGTAEVEEERGRAVGLRRGPCL